MPKTTECCALCNTEVECEPDTPTYNRRHYIDTAGQLCPDCYETIAVNKEWHNLL